MELRLAEGVLAGEPDAAFWMLRAQGDVRRLRGLVTNWGS